MEDDLDDKARAGRPMAVSSRDVEKCCCSSASPMCVDTSSQLRAKLTSMTTMTKSGVQDGIDSPGVQVEEVS